MVESRVGRGRREIGRLLPTVFSNIPPATGRFELRGGPPGKHRIAIRQPDVGFTRDIEVVVTESDAANVEIRFREEDLHLN